jgi:prepilin-type N-terminal cleavage/methylation domain-containing protein
MSHSPSPSVRPAGSRLCRRLRSNHGFTLIEVLVSALMIVLIGSAAATALIATSAASGDERFRSQADQLAAQDLSRLQGLSDEQLNDYNQTRPVTLNGSTYQVTSTASFQDTGGKSGCASTVAAYFKTSSSVSWTESGSTQKIVEESLLARPVTGDLRTQVEDQTLSPLSGATVTATGPDTQSATTDSTGCVLFAGLDPGGYVVTATDAGYITPNATSALTPPAGTTSPFSGPATVTSSGVAVPTGSPFEIGLPGSIIATFQTPTGLPGEASGITWSGSPVSSSAVTGTNPALNSSVVHQTFTTGSLFPFDKSSTSTASYTNNYSVWAGDCAQEQPQPPTAYDQFTVPPGSLNTAQTIIEPDLYLGTVSTQTAVGATVVAAHPTSVSLQSTGTSGCTDTWYPTLSGTVGTTPPPNGWLANPGQPYSPNLTLCASAVISGTTYHASAPVTGGNTNFAASNSATITITKGASGTSTGSC